MVSEAEVDALVARLRVDGPKIGEQCNAGDIKATNVVNLYKLYLRRPEPAAFGLLTAAYEEWKVQNNAAKV